MIDVNQSPDEDITTRSRTRAKPDIGAVER
jgi:hypothetical protein